MLASNANGEDFSLQPLWTKRKREEVVPTEDATEDLAQEVPARALLVAVAVLVPVDLLSVIGSDRQRLDGTEVLRGERILLTNQNDARENGLWLVGTGSPVQSDVAFRGMLVRSLRGSKTSGWLFCCTTQRCCV